MNVSSGSESTLSPAFEGVISNELTPKLLIGLCFLNLTFSIPAIALNIANVVIFLALGVKDSVTVSFLALSVGDLISVVFLSVASVMSLMMNFGIAWSKNIPAIGFIITKVFGTANDFTAAVTTYIALQRGLCVAMPFITRHLFNRNRSIIIVVTIFLVIIAIKMPRFVTFRLVSVPDSSDNTTSVLGLEFMDIYTMLNGLYLIFMRTIVVFLEYVIMIVNATIIAIGMRSSAKLKLSSSASSKQENIKCKEIESASKDVASKEQRETKTGTGKPTKEMLVTKQTFIVVVIYVVFATPSIIACIYQFMEPRFTFGKAFNNLYFVVYTGIDVTMSVNGFVNFFVYYRFNSKFRSCFKSLLFKQSKKM